MKQIHYPTVVVFLAVVIMLSLCLWQIVRGMDKQQRLAQMETMDTRSMLTLSQLISHGVDGMEDARLGLYGEFEQSRYFLLDNRIRSGVVGYEVIAPLVTDEGPVLVNLGWLKAPPYRDQMPHVDMPQGVTNVQGRIKQPNINPMVSETLEHVTQWPAVIQAVDIEKMREWSKMRLLPFVLVATDDTAPTLRKQWQPVVMPPEKHFGYALQWFGLAIAAFWIYWLSRANNNNKRNTNAK